MVDIKALTDIAEKCTNYASIAGKKAILETLPIKPEEIKSTLNPFLMDAKAILAQLNITKPIDTVSLEIKTLLEKLECDGKPKFSDEAVEALIPTVKKLFNIPETKEFTEALLKDKDFDNFSSALILENLSKDNVNRYKQLFAEKMPDGSKRFSGLGLFQAQTSLETEDACFKSLYASVDDSGKLRFSGDDIRDLQIKVATKYLLNAEFDEENLLKEIPNILNLRNTNGELFTGDQLSLLMSLEASSNNLSLEKLSKIKSIEELSLGDRKELLYALEMTKQQITQMTRMLESQGMNVEKVIPNFKKLDLPFIDVDDAGKLDTKKLAASLVEDGKNIIKVRKLNNSEMLKGFKSGMAKLENVLSLGKIDVAEIKEIKLAYPRASFITDAKKAMSGLSEEEAKEFTRVFGFDFAGSDLVKYPVTATKKEISQISNPQVRQAVERFNANVERFTVGNKISIPEAPELETALNEITSAYPEFLTTIGKVQHGDHSYTLDLHILKTMQEALKDPRWAKLNETDKKLTKIAILFHDIAKTEGQVDKLHHIISAQDVATLLKKSDLSEIEKERVIGLVKNHHWLEQINQPMTQDEAEMLGLKLAFEFRKPNDWQIAQIFAKADLKAASDNVYQAFNNALKLPIVKQIGKNIDRIHSSSIFLPQTAIPKASQLRNIETSAISTVEGITNNKIVHLTDSADLPSMGFASTATPQNFRALVHVINPENKGFIQMLDSATQEGSNGVFSTSYVTKDKVATLFNDDGFSNSGIIFNADQNNIAAAYPQDMDSGRMKSVTDIMNYLFVNKPEHEVTYLKMLAEKGNESSIFAKLQSTLQGATKFEDIENEFQRDNIKTLFERRLRHRNYLASKVKESLHFSDEEYIKLMREISQYQSVDEIKKPQVKKAITEAADSLMNYKNAPDHDEPLFDYTWNEAVAYAPKPQAVFAKSCNPEEIPFELRKYAQDHDLPIVMFGNEINALS